MQNAGGVDGLGLLADLPCSPTLMGFKNPRLPAASVADSFVFGGVNSSGGAGSPPRHQALSNLLGIWGAQQQQQQVQQQQQQQPSLCSSGDAGAPELFEGPVGEQTGSPAGRRDDWKWGQTPLFFHQPTPPSW